MLRFPRNPGACLALSLLLLPLPASAQLARIGEIRLDNIGGVDEEYLEIQGPPGTPLDGLAVVVLGDELTDGSGAVEAVIDLFGQVIPGDGHFLIADQVDFGNGALNLSGSVDLAVPLDFEDGDNRTFLLVDGLHPDVVPGSDVDQNADGVIDDPCNCTTPPGPPWAAVLDAVATIQFPAGGNLTYAPAQIGPDGPNPPAQIFRCDANPFDWQGGAPDSPATDTPGDPNAPVCGSGLLTREQATQIFLGTLDPGDPDTATTAAWLYLQSDPGDSTLMPGDVVSDYDSTFFQPIVNPTYLFWVDFQVDHFLGHRTEFVFVDATNGVPVSVESTTWPVRNGAEIDTFLVENETSPDLVFGSGFVGNDPPPVLFNPEPQPASKKWAIVVGGRDIHRGANPDSSAIQGDVARGYRYLNGTGFQGPEIDSANITVLLKRPPKPNGTQRLGTGASADQIKQALCALGDQPERCEKLYFFYYGHGTSSGRIILSSKSGGSKSSLSYRQLAKWIKKANAKEVCILIMDCYSGTSIKFFSAEDLVGSVITSSDFASPTFRHPDGSAFMFGFLRCALSPVSDLNGDGEKTMAEVLAWTIAASDSANTKKPGSVVLTGKKPETVAPPECFTYEEWPGGKKTKRIVTKGVPRPVAGGTVTVKDDDDEVQRPGYLRYEIKEFSYDDPGGSSTGADTVRTKRWLYVENLYPRVKSASGASLGTIKPKFKVNVYCIGENGETPYKTLFTEIEGQRRLCYIPLPDDCKSIRLERGAAIPPGGTCPLSADLPGKGGILGAANVLDLDSLVGPGFGGAFDAGEFLLATTPVAAESLTVFHASVAGPPGWNASVSPSGSFFIPSGCDSELVLVRATVPDTATAGGLLTLSLVDSAAAETTLTVFNAMLLDTLLAPIGAGDAFSSHSLHTTSGAAVAGGTLTLDRSAVNIRGNADFSVSGGAAFSAHLSTVYVDTSWTSAFSVVSSTVDLEHLGVVGASDGIELDLVEGSLFGVGSLASRGDGIRFAPGAYDSLSVEGLRVDEPVGDGVVLDAATGVRLRDLEVNAAGGQDLRVENGSSLDVVDAVLDPASITVDGTSSFVRRWSRLYRTEAANGDSLPGVDLTVVDALGDTVAVGTTGSDGYLDVLELAEWGRSGGVLTTYTPYTVHATLGLHDTTLVDTVVSRQGFPVVFTGIGSTTDVPDPGPAVTLRLSRNFPNPFSSATRFEFALPERGRVRVEILDTAGRRVALLNDGVLGQGEHRIEWEVGPRVASGVYYARVLAGERILTRKLLLIR